MTITKIWIAVLLTGSVQAVSGLTSAPQGESTAQEVKPASVRFGAFVEQHKDDVGADRLLFDANGKAISDEDESQSTYAGDGPRVACLRALARTADHTVFALWGGVDTLTVAREFDDQVHVAERRGSDVGELRDPSGMAIDAQKPLRVLVADTLNHRIDVFTGEGKALGSFGARGSGDGMLDHPSDVVVDAEGNAFVSDTGNDRIVEFDAQGTFLRNIGGRGSYPGLFAAPSGLDLFHDELFVADRDNHRVQVLGLDGQYRYEWGLHALRPREGAGRFHYPCDVRVTPDGSRVLVLEEIEDRVQQFGPVTGEIEIAQGERDTSAHYAGGCSLRGDVLATIEPSGPSVSIWDLTHGTPIEVTRFGRYGRGAGLMVRPSSVLLDASAEIVYVADPYASRISAFRIARKRDEPLKYERDLARLVRSVDLTSTTLPLRDRWTIEPEGLALGADGEILVADRANARVVVFSPELVPVRAFGVPIDPVGIAFDASSGRTFVTDPVARALAIVARDGTLEKVVEAHTAQPFGVAVGAQGKVWVTDRKNGLLLELAGDKLVFATTCTAPTPDRLGRGEFVKPEGIACDARGRVLVVEAGNHRFQLFDADGKYVDMGGARFYTEAARTPPAPVVAHAWDNAHCVTTNGGAWRVLWRAKPATIPRGDAFSIEAWVFAAGDPMHPARDAKLAVDAWMPDHMHGMTRVPTVKRRDDGGFDVEGMLFHMSGTWEIDFDVVKDAVAERAQTRMELE